MARRSGQTGFAELSGELLLRSYVHGPAGQGDDPDIESSLRTCIKLNPGFAPAYDALARYYMRDPAKTNEAHMMNIQAVSLEPDNIGYRLNAASVLMNAQRY
jgi:cytochrome c-type biogenesis protein CcmH/NrfG